MSLQLYSHPFAMYCWKPLIALYERGVEFEAKLVEDRTELAKLWAPAAIPLLVDDGDAPPMLPAHADDQLQVRIWDRVMDGYVSTPVQRIVGDALRPADAKDPYGVAQAHAALDLAYNLLDGQLKERDSDGWLATDDFSLADCSALPALHYADVLHELERGLYPALGAYYDRLLAHPASKRVIDDARPLRHFFPLPWPAHVV
jgi:glutathione S-transferase